MGKCWGCGKEIGIMGMAFCSFDCAKNYRSKVTEDQRREQQVINKDADNKRLPNGREIIQ